MRDDQRWVYGIPRRAIRTSPRCRTSAPSRHRGSEGFVLANGSVSSNQSGEGEIRKNIVAADPVDCIVALPGQLIHSTQISAWLWFLSKGRRAGEYRDREGEVLFIDARTMGRMTDRTHRELTAEDIARIAAPTMLGPAGRALASTPTCPASGSRRTSRRAAARARAHARTLRRRGATGGPSRSARR